jgi:hypothetical protein
MGNAAGDGSVGKVEGAGSAITVATGEAGSETVAGADTISVDEADEMGADGTASTKAG